LSTTDQDFFQQKRLWSGVKDRILGTYIVPYLKKVATLQARIMIVDAFAGPGRFKDGTKGSPLILTEAAEQFVPDQYVAYFVNHRRAQHEALEKNLAPLVAAGKVRCFNMTAAKFLPMRPQRLRILGGRALSSTSAAVQHGDPDQRECVDDSPACDLPRPGARRVEQPHGRAQRSAQAGDGRQLLAVDLR